MLQHPAPPPSRLPVIIREGETDDIVINPAGRTQLRFRRMTFFSGNVWHAAWEIVIFHRKRERARFTSPSPRLPTAMIAAVEACVRFDFLQPPHDGNGTRYLAKKAWYTRERITGHAPVSYDVRSIGCRCGPHCQRHRPLLQFTTTDDGRHQVLCLGDICVTDNCFAAITWAVSLLVSRRYLR